jgi:hypothetical protein
MLSSARALAVHPAAPPLVASSFPPACKRFTERPSTSGGRGVRPNVVCSARFGFGVPESVEAVEDDDDALLSRRTMLAGKALFTIGEAFVFPWATESATRPGSAVTENLVPFSTPWLKTMLFNETDPVAKARAKNYLLDGEALAASGDHLAAIALFEKVKINAPTEYKMCQRAGLNIAKSFKKLSSRPGDAYDKSAETAKGEVWWWGRGTRWPGWYIVAYLSARNLYFTAKEDDVATFTVTEGLGFLVPIWLGLLIVLVTYGLPDY